MALLDACFLLGLFMEIYSLRCGYNAYDSDLYGYHRNISYKRKMISNISIIYLLKGTYPDELVNKAAWYEFFKVP